jgi:hypothetical protein
VAEQETIGSGYLYPSKPFNVLNPTGVSPEQSVEVFNQQKMQRTQLGFQAGENDKDRMVQSEEKERDRQHEALLGDKQMAAGQEMQRREQEARAAEEQKRQVFEAGENEKTRDIQKKELEYARSSEDRRLKTEQNNEMHRRKMEETTLKLKSDGMKLDWLRDEYMMKKEQAGFDNAAEYEPKFRQINNEIDINTRQMTGLSILAATLQKAKDPEAVGALTKRLREVVAVDMSLTETALPSIEAAIYNMKTNTGAKSPPKEGRKGWEGLVKDSVEGVARFIVRNNPNMQLAEDAMDIAESQKRAVGEWEGLAGAIASTALTGEIKTAEGMPAQQYVSGKLARMMWALDKAEGPDRTTMMQIAADEYNQLAQSGVNMRNLDKHMRLAHDLLGGNGPGIGVMDNAARGVAAQQTGITPVGAEGLFDGKKKASSLARMLQLVDPKTNKSLVSNWNGSEMMFEERTVNGQKVRVLKNDVEDKVTKALVELVADQEFAGMSTMLLDGAIDDDPNTAPEFARMMSTLPPSAQEQVKQYVWGIKKRIQSEYNKDRTFWDTFNDPENPLNMSRVQEEKRALDRRQQQLEAEQAKNLGARNKGVLGEYGTKRGEIGRGMDDTILSIFEGD